MVILQHTSTALLPYVIMSVQIFPRASSRYAFTSTELLHVCFYTLFMAQSMFRTLIKLYLDSASFVMGLDTLKKL